MRTLAVALLSLLALAVPAGAVEWERVEAPVESGQGHVYRSAAAFGEEAWAVGYTYSTVGGPLVFRTLIQRWDGAGWSRVATPGQLATTLRSLLFDVATNGPARAWAVGSRSSQFGPPATLPLVLTWDGASWSLVDGPAGFAGALTAVAAAADGSVMVGGEGRNPQTGYTVPRVFLRAESGWQEVAFPSIPGCATSANGVMARAELTDLASRGLRGTWATGSCAVAGGGERGFLARFNGTRWLPVLTPDELLASGERGQLGGVSIAPDGDVWAVGWSDVGGVTRPLAFRGKGGNVKPVVAPTQGTGATLRAVAAERDGAVAAAGAFTHQYDNSPHPHLVGADAAGSLAVEPLADPTVVGNLYGIALTPTGDAWAVGVSSWDFRGLILRRRP